MRSVSPRCAAAVGALPARFASTRRTADAAVGDRPTLPLMNKPRSRFEVTYTVGGILSSMIGFLFAFTVMASMPIGPSGPLADDAARRAEEKAATAVRRRKATPDGAAD